MSLENQTSEASTLPNLNAQQEKAAHYSYLKDFRVEPCPLFKQHQCQQHRPYSCFYWHFANQRRRRPVRKKDFTFNYSADVYCTKYDENTGICADGDECPFLHRVYGDVERKYHLRYYKTALCVHSVDNKGHCLKNGQHCAFAHGPDDLRNPIFDIRELQQSTESSGENIERDRLNFVIEDPIWQGQDYVLANYKTELCKKPPRLCRQGYACPFYHNSKDKRRCTVSVKYRSTPCPSVKRGDEWGEPESCESGESCAYCHTRTEQQFHPEIYKSTKCNDMQQHGYCPRGPFCAFAHSENELHVERQIKEMVVKKLSTPSSSSVSPSTGSSPLVSILSNGKRTENGGGVTAVSPNGHHAACSPPRSSTISCAAFELQQSQRKRVSIDSVPCLMESKNSPINNATPSATAQKSAVAAGQQEENLHSLLGSHKASLDNNFVFSPSPPPIGHQKNLADSPVRLANDTGILSPALSAPSYSAVLKQRHHSESGSKCSTKNGIILEIDASQDLYNYSKAPGFEREQQSPNKIWSSNEIDVNNDALNNISKIKASLYFSHEIGCDLVQPQTTIAAGIPVQHVNGVSVPLSASPPTSNSSHSNSFSPFSAAQLAPVWQLVKENGSHVEDLIEDEFSSIMEKDDLNKVLNGPCRRNLYSLSSPCSAPMSLPNAVDGIFPSSDNNRAANGYLVSPGVNRVGGSGQQQNYFSFSGLSDNTHRLFRASGSVGSKTYCRDMNMSNGIEPGNFSGNGVSNTALLNELQRTREELNAYKIKSSSLEENLKMMKQGYESWRKRMEEYRRKELVLEQEKIQATQERDLEAAAVECCQMQELL